MRTTYFLIITTIILLAFGLTFDLRADVASDACKLIHKREFSKAIEMLKTAIKKDKGYAQLYCALGRAYFETGRFEEAEVELENCLDRKRKHEEAKYYLGLVYIEQERWEDAREIFDKGINKSKKKKGMFYNGLGLYHLAQGELSEADLAFRRALVEEEDNLEYRRNLADVNYENGVYAVAISGYKEVLAADSTDILAHFKMGKALYMQREFSEAIASLSRSMQLDSNYLESYKISGDIYMLFAFAANGNGNGNGDAKERFSSAIWEYNQYVERGGELTGEIAYRVGQAYYNVNGYDAAAENLAKAIELGYEKDNAYNLYSKALFRLQRYDEAIAAYDAYEQKVSGGDPNYQWTVEDYGFFKEKAQTFYQLYSESRQAKEPDSTLLERAIPAYEQALALNDEDLNLFDQVGLANYYYGDYQRAIQWFETKIEKDSMAFNTYLNMSYCYLKTSDYLKAMEQMIRATEIKPDYCTAYKTIANTYLHQVKDRSEAVKWYLKWAECDSASHEPYKWLGYMAMSSKPIKKDQAVKHLLKTWNKMRQNGTPACDEFDVIKWLGQVYNMYDDADMEDKALEWAKRGLKCKPNDKDLKDIKEALE